MLRRYRRPIAAFMGALVLHSTVVPIALEAADATVTARRNAMAITETVEFFARDGRLEHRAEGSGLLARAAAQMAAIRTVDELALRSLAASLRERSTASKVGAVKIAGILQVIEAVAAQTDEEYYARVRKLPVRVVKSEVQDEHLRIGVQTEYWISGVLRARTFAINGGQRSEPFAAPETTALSDSVSDEEFVGPSYPSNAARAPFSETCEYSDPDDGNYSGECATSEEVEAAIMALLSLEDEIAIIDTGVDEATDEFDEWCDENPTECYYSESIETTVGGPSAPLDVERKCGGNAAGYALSLGFFVLRAWKLGLVVAAVAPPAGAVVEAIALGVGAAGAVAIAAMALHECYMDPS